MEALGLHASRFLKDVLLSDGVWIRCFNIYYKCYLRFDRHPASSPKTLHTGSFWELEEICEKILVYTKDLVC